MQKSRSDSETSTRSSSSNSSSVYVIIKPYKDITTFDGTNIVDQPNDVNSTCSQKNENVESNDIGTEDNDSISVDSDFKTGESADGANESDHEDVYRTKSGRRVRQPKRCSPSNYCIQQ